MDGDLASEDSHGAKNSDVDLTRGPAVVTFRGMDADEKRRTYAACRAIKSHFYAVGESIVYGKPDVGAGDTVNPYYNRTASGLFVEFYYGTPLYVWTPWGKWRMRMRCVSGMRVAIDDASMAFLRRVHTTLHQPQTNSAMGSFGPVYAVVSVDGCEPVPAPVVGAAYVNDGYDAMMTEWAELTAAYDAAHAENT